MVPAVLFLNQDVFEGDFTAVQIQPYVASTFMRDRYASLRLNGKGLSLLRDHSG